MARMPRLPAMLDPRQQPASSCGAAPGRPARLPAGPLLVATAVCALWSARAASVPLVVQWEKPGVRAGGAKGFTELATGDLLATRTVRRGQAAEVICARSRDGGKSWHDLATIVRDETPGSDIGDGHLIELRDRTILYSYRANHYRAVAADHPRYQIRVAASRDGGSSWAAHSIVKSVSAAKGEVRGLWSSCLHQRRDGTLLCFYDDEDAAWCAGFERHQWLMMQQWNETARAWSSPVVVSRAADPRHLSRDGMPSVVEGRNGELLCALESVSEERPHWNVVRLVRSADGGKTWDWRTSGRPVVHQSTKRGFGAVSPWLAALDDATLVCVFATDEDRATPDPPGAAVGAMNRDIKFVVSADNGVTWSRQAAGVATDTHKTYMPQLTRLRHPRHRNTMLCLYLDTTLGFRGIRGTWPGPAAIGN